MEKPWKWVLLLLLFAQASQAEIDIDEGLWEFTIGYEFIGVPQHFPEYTNRQCVSNEEPVPAISRPGQDCDYKLQGRFGSSTVTWELDCSTLWEMVHGMGRIYYDGDRAKGDVHVQVVNPYSPPQPMVFQIRGKRLGDCED